MQKAQPRWAALLQIAIIAVKPCRSDGCGGAEHIDAVAEARDFARHGVLVQNAFGDAAHHFGLGGFQRSGGCRLIAGRQRLFDFADKGADPRTARLVHILARFGLTGALFGLGGICHVGFDVRWVGMI